MGLILDISKERLNEIIKREVAKGMRELALYPIVASKSPAHKKLPSRGTRNLDFDYQNMELKFDYAASQEEQFQIQYVKIQVPYTVFLYGGLHVNPFARPVGGPVYNWPLVKPNAILCTISGPITIHLWQDKNQIWDGKINWQEEGISVEESMIEFID